MNYFAITQVCRSMIQEQSYSYSFPLSLPRKLLVFMEVSVLGAAQSNHLSRTGIYFYINNLVTSISARNDIDLVPWCGDPSLLRDTLNACESLNLNTTLVRSQRLVYFLSSISFRLSHNRLTSVPVLKRALLSLSAIFHKASSKCHQLSFYSQVRKIIASKSTLYGPASSPAKSILHFTYRCYDWPTVPRDLRLSFQRFVTSYDLIPHLFPTLCALGEPARFNEFLQGIRSSDHILAISESTKADLAAALPKLIKSNIHVTPLAASNSYTSFTSADLSCHHASSVSLPLILPSRYILSVATLEPRKNILSLLDAFAKVFFSVSQPDLSLVLVGGKGWVQADLTLHAESLGISSNVVFTGYLPDECLPLVYKQALFFVYPSLYEGFGLPVLEAMQCGLPVITSNNSSLAEIATNAALLVDASSVDEIADAIQIFISDRKIRDRYRKASIARASAFSWVSTAEKTVRAYNRSLDHD